MAKPRRKPKPKPNPQPRPKYFVSPAGNDANPGTKEKPWKSIEKINTIK